jgi:hypothetical protein
MSEVAQRALDTSTRTSSDQRAPDSNSSSNVEVALTSAASFQTKTRTNLLIVSGGIAENRFYQTAFREAFEQIKHQNVGLKDVKIELLLRSPGDKWSVVARGQSSDRIRSTFQAVSTKA